MLLWAICFPLIVAGFAWAPHLTFAALRALIAGAVLLGVGLWLGRSFPRGLRVWLILSLVGFGATSIAYLGMFHAAEFVSPGVATVIANSQPLLAAIMAALVLGERLTGRGKLGLALGFSGIIFIAAPQFMNDTGGSYTIGIGFILFSALGITLSNVLIRHLGDEVDALMAMGLQMLIGALPLLVAAFVLERPATVIWSWQFILILLTLALPGSALAYWLWNMVLQRIELNRANAFSFLVPLFGLAMGAAFFGESLGVSQLIGIALILPGIVLTSYNKTPEPGATDGAAHAVTRRATNNSAPDQSPQVSGAQAPGSASQAGRI
jgi:drug/metabolite transporter (DMT)-like permease